MYKHINVFYKSDWFIIVDLYYKTNYDIFNLVYHFMGNMFYVYNIVYLN